MTPLHTERWGDDGAARRALLLPGITSSAATMWEVGEGLAAAGWSAVAQPNWHPRTVAERVRSTRSTGVTAVAGYATQNRPWDVREPARAVRVPVHVLVPAEAALVTDGLLAELSAHTRPRWTVETVAGATHSVHRDRPALVVDRAVRPPEGA